MRIRSDVLANDLKEGLKPVYLLTGDEPLQLIESADMIRQAARQQGHTEREVFHVDPGFDWGALLQAANSLSLFAEKKILELRFNSAKVGDVGSKRLIEYCSCISPDNILVISMPKLDKRSLVAKWCLAIENVGGILQVWPIEGNQLIQWIMRRAQSRGLTVTREVAGLLAAKVEGNLLAAAQEIEKLSLNGVTALSAEDIVESADDDAKYDVFKLVDAAMAGKTRRVAKILFSLEAGGESPVLVLWALTREIRTMAAVSHDAGRGVPMNKVFSQHRIWDNRASLVKLGLTRYKADQWLALLSQAIQVDQIIKGLQRGNEWDALLDLGFSISGKVLLENKV